MIKNFRGFEKESISNIDKFESYISLIECIKCKKISFPPCECKFCQKCICQNCNENEKLICSLCGNKLLFFPDDLKQIYREFIIKCKNCNENLYINQIIEHKKTCSCSYDIINIEGDINKPLKNVLNDSFEELKNNDKEIEELKKRVSILEQLVKNLYSEIDKLKKEKNNN